MQVKIYKKHYFLSVFAFFFYQIIVNSSVAKKLKTEHLSLGSISDNFKISKLQDFSISLKLLNCHQDLLGRYALHGFY